MKCQKLHLILLHGQNVLFMGQYIITARTAVYVSVIPFCNFCVKLRFWISFQKSVEKLKQTVEKCMEVNKMLLIAEVSSTG